MPAIYHPGVVQIVPHYNIGSGRDAVNVLYWKTAATGLTPAQLNSVRGVFDTGWKNIVLNLMPSTISYLGAWVTDMGSNTGAQVTNTGFTPAPGVNASGELGDQVAILMSLHAATRYRGGHSRLYLPGIGVNNVANDGRTLTNTPITAITTNWGNLLTSMAAITGTNGGPYTPIVWHKKWATAPNTTEDITTMVVSPILATQRRRLRKVSRHRKHTTP